MRKVFLGGTLALLFLAPAATARVPRPDPMPEIRYAACPFYERVLGCVNDRPPYVVWVDPRAGASRLVRWHELGHVFDFQHMSPDERARWGRAAGRRWDKEQFADSYMLCTARSRLRHRPAPDTLNLFYGYRPTPRQHRRVCKLISRARQE